MLTLLLGECVNPTEKEGSIDVIDVIDVECNRCYIPRLSKAQLA